MKKTRGGFLRESMGVCKGNRVDECGTRRCQLMHVTESTGILNNSICPTAGFVFDSERFCNKTFDKRNGKRQHALPKLLAMKMLRQHDHHRSAHLLPSRRIQSGFPGCPTLQASILSCAAFMPSNVSLALLKFCTAASA